MYDKEKGLCVAHCSKGFLSIKGQMANRHGLIAGATGTGKTVTLQVLAETFSQAGVPCFMADMKGDLSGVCKEGRMNGFIGERCQEFGISSPLFQGAPVRFYDVFQEQGHPLRTTISDMGPDLLSRLLDLNETQNGIMNIVFKVADDRGLLLLDLKDLRSMLDYVQKHAREFSGTYGNVTPQSVGAIQRALLQLENQGAEMFFAEPAFDIFDLLAKEDGRGVLSVLAADRLMLNPRLYSTFLLWLLSELYARLPEVGDQALPRLVFFFDEAHTLFQGTSKALRDKIEQVIRLIRSKGVGIYFVTQKPTDIPEDILSQLGNRIQHALRAFTPKDAKDVKATAQTFRANPEFDTQEAIMQLETGEALVSFLDEKGAPGIVERARILFPLSQIGAITPQDRQAIITGSAIFGKYDQSIDRESAFEVLLRQSQEQAAILANQKAEMEQARQEKKDGKKKSIARTILTAVASAVIASVSRSVATSVTGAITGKKKSRSSKGVLQDAAGKALNSATSTATRQITRSILGSLIK